MRRKRIVKERIGAFVLALVMIAAVLPGESVYAAENDQVETMAASMNVNTWVTDNLVDYNDVNEYDFRLSGAGNISISFNHGFIDNEVGYWRLEIYNSGGKKVLERTFSGNSTEETTTKIGLPAGNYHIKIENYAGYSDMPYTFKVNYTTCNDWEKEVNDLTENANDISANEYVNGSLGDYNDVDWYKTTLGSAGKISISFNHGFIDNEVGYWRLGIYNSGGKKVLERTFSGNSTEETTTEIGLPAGNYHIKIENYAGYSDMPYSFKINTGSSQPTDPEPPIDIELPYIDALENDWFYNAVCYNYMEGIMTGIDEWHFAPYQNLARAQFAVILHRLNNEPKVYYSYKFPDIPKGQWYTDAVLWASSIGVVSGYSNTGKFGPGDNITREQMAVMLYRYAKHKGYSTGGMIEFNRFDDAWAVSLYARDAMKWAVGNKIITGKYGETLLNPQGSTNRGECAIIMQRFLEKYK